MKNLDFLSSNLIAHRGLHNDKYPENSLGAFKRAKIRLINRRIKNEQRKSK